MIGIDGTKARELEELTFEPGTLLVIEMKTTLGMSKTPGLLETQAGGDRKNLNRIQRLVQDKAQGWDADISNKLNPNFSAHLAAVKNSTKRNKTTFLHAQVFIGPHGGLNEIAGHGSGVQINKWDQL